MSWLCGLLIAVFCVEQACLSRSMLFGETENGALISKWHTYRLISPKGGDQNPEAWQPLSTFDGNDVSTSCSAGAESTVGGSAPSSIFVTPATARAPQNIVLTIFANAKNRMCCWAERKWAAKALNASNTSKIYADAFWWWMRFCSCNEHFLNLYKYKIWKMESVYRVAKGTV